MSTQAAQPGSERAVYATFALQAFASGGALTRVPEFQQKTGIGEAELGLVFTLAALGGILTTFVAGQLTVRFGTTRINLMSIVALALSGVLAALASSFITLALVFAATGAAFGLSNVAMNLEADRAEAALGRRIMNRCHGLWSVGVLLATAIGVGARAVPVAPVWHLLGMMALVVLALIWLGPNMVPAPRRGQGRPSSRLAKPDRTTIILVAFALIGGSAHMLTNTWAVIFARDLFNAADWIDTLTLPSFLAAMTIGRLFADQWVDHFGPTKTSRVLAVITITGVLIVVLSPNVWAAILGFGLIGLGTGPLFPLMVSAAGRDQNRTPEDAVAAAILLISAIGVVSPAIYGWIAEAAGLRVMFATTLPLCLLTYVLAKRLNA